MPNAALYERIGGHRLNSVRALSPLYESINSHIGLDKSIAKLTDVYEHNLCPIAYAGYYKTSLVSVSSEIATYMWYLHLKKVFMQNIDIM